jgi:hypothetical protein
VDQTDLKQFFYAEITPLLKPVILALSLKSDGQTSQNQSK